MLEFGVTCSFLHFKKYITRKRKSNNENNNPFVQTEGTQLDTADRKRNDGRGATEVCKMKSSMQ